MATALAVAGIAATVIATGVTVYGQEQAGKAAQGQANYQALSHATMSSRRSRRRTRRSSKATSKPRKPR